MRTRSIVTACFVLCLVGHAFPSRAAVTVVDAHAIYPEGPLWQNGKLLYVEYGGPGVKMWDGRAAKSFWSTEHCGPSGLIAYGRAHILVACYDTNTLVELDESGRAVRTIDKDSNGKPFIGPNDFAADRAGGVYFPHRASTTSRRPSPAPSCTYRRRASSRKLPTRFTIPTA